MFVVWDYNEHQLGGDQRLLVSEPARLPSAKGILNFGGGNFTYPLKYTGCNDYGMNPRTYMECGRNVNGSVLDLDNHQHQVTISTSGGGCKKGQTVPRVELKFTGVRKLKK